MRNNAAHFDDDFDLKEPARKKATRRPAPGTKKPKGKSRFGVNFDLKPVARYAAIGMSATVALGIMVNALVLQKGRHPAPLFGTSIALGEHQSRPAVKAPPVQHVTIEAPAADEATHPVKARPLALQSEDPAPTSGEQASGDQIARLLQGGSVPFEKPDPKTVAGAQRALIKLGFVLKPTGTFGPQTKKALETFEKDRHLPVNGELTRRMIRILAAESGLKIER